MNGRRERLSVLVVNDHAYSAESLAEMLNCVGYFARSASSDTQAQQLSLEEPPNVVILDGLFALQADRNPLQPGFSMPLSRRPLVIAVTGYRTANTLRRTAHSDLILHLFKPICLTTLRGVLERYWNRIAAVEVVAESSWHETHL